MTDNCTYIIEGVRTDLVALWRKNIREIMNRLNISYEELGKTCGVSHTSACSMLTRADMRLTGLQFLGVMHAIEALLTTRKYDEQSYYLFDEIEDEWSSNGLKEGK